MSKRRLNGEGSITMHKGSGLYTAMITDEDGKRHHFYDKTQAGAKKKLRDALRKVEDWATLNPARISLKDYLNDWLANRRDLKPKTIESYEVTIRVHLIPRLGHIKLQKLNEDHINKAWNDLLENGHSTSIVEHCHIVLQTALNRAVFRRFVVGNPMLFVDKPIARTPEMRALTIEECRRVLEESKNTEYFPLIHTALYTGMRRNELLGLKWKRVDLDGGLVEVRESLHVRKGGKIEYLTPKTDTGVRTEALGVESVAILRNELDRQFDKGRSPVTPETPVFLNETGGLLLPNTVSHAFLRMVRKLEIKDVSFHNLRHTHLSIMDKAGVGAKQLQERAGHSDIRTTMNIYVHTDMTMQREAVKKFSLAMNE